MMNDNARRAVLQQLLEDDAIGQLRRRRGCRGHLQQCRGGVVHQHEIAVLVLNGDTGRKQFEDIAQDSQLGFKIAFITGLHRDRLFSLSPARYALT